jgi:hypothetical protein
VECQNGLVYLEGIQLLADRIRMCSFKSKGQLIDRTIPTVVTNEAYTTVGNGGRKLVRVSDGALIASARNTSTNLYIYKSSNNGASFTSPTNIGMSGLNDWTIVNNKDYIFIILCIGTSTIQVRTYRNSDFAFIRSDNISANSTSLGTISATINKQGTEIHVCWSDRRTAYPSSYNIRYCKGVIGSDGKGIWSIAEQITISNTPNVDNVYPTIILKNNGFPIIFYSYNESGSVKYSGIHAENYNGSSWIRVFIYYISDSTLYVQANPSVCIDKDGLIHLFWHGTSSNQTSPVIRCSRSFDGVTWSDPVDLNNGTYVSCSVNVKGHVFIQYRYGYNVAMRQSRDKGINFGSHTIMDASAHPNLLLDNELDFEIPLGIRQTTTNVIFSGKWYE